VKRDPGVTERDKQTGIRDTIIDGRRRWRWLWL